VAKKAKKRVESPEARLRRMARERESYVRGEEAQKLALEAYRAGKYVIEFEQGRVFSVVKGRLKEIGWNIKPSDRSTYRHKSLTLTFKGRQLKILLHRFLWLCFHNEIIPPGFDIHHIKEPIQVEFFNGIKNLEKKWGRDHNSGERLGVSRNVGMTRKRITEKEGTYIRRALAAGKNYIYIGKKLGRNESTIRHYAIRNNLRSAACQNSSPKTVDVERNTPVDSAETPKTANPGLI